MPNSARRTRILALPDPGADIPYAQAMWRYARSLAATAKGDFTGAEAEANAITGIANRADFSALQAVGIPATDVLKLARALADGRLAQAQGDSKAAIASFEEAAALQDGLPYTEPPFWYYPVRQTLAAALLQAGRLDEAEAQFKRALERAPNNGWSYYGLAKVYAALGNAEAAKQAEENLAKTGSATAPCCSSRSSNRDPIDLNCTFRNHALGTRATVSEL